MSSSALIPPSECEVVIVGAGVAGSGSAYHLCQAGVQNVLVVEAGPAAGEGMAPRHSGTATMPSTVAPTVKMMCQLYASSSDHFIHHHGRKGASRYLRATAKGLQLQKEIAAQVLDEPSEQLREMGSYYVAYEHDREALKREYETLKSLGSCDEIEWLDSKESLQAVPGCSSDFDCAIFLPKDAVIDSSSYAKALLRTVLKEQPSYHFMANTRVTQVLEDAEQMTALVELDSGVRICCKHVIMATGGLFQVAQLNGLMKPCYSYLVHVPITTTGTSSAPPSTTSCVEHSPNFFTWGYTHDWCFTNGKVRISGEDHFSAYKPPFCKERCANLARWTLEKYGVDPESVDTDSLPQQYGVYSETADLVPLCGHVNPSSRICYLLGCNAWGQTVFSYCSSLVPGLLGYKDLTEDQKDSLELLSVRRFSHLPSCN